MDEPPIYDPKLTREDVRAIKAIITSTPGISHNILDVRIRDEKSVVVRTGTIHNPRFGSGQLVTLERDVATWKIGGVSGWIS